VAAHCPRLEELDVSRLHRADGRQSAGAGRQLPAPPKCATHAGQDLLLACLHPGCRQLLCTLCAHSAAHKPHVVDVLNLEDASTRVRAELAAAAGALEPQLAALSELHGELSQRAGVLAREAAVAESRVKEAFRALIARLEAQRDALVQRVRSSVAVMAAQAEGAGSLVSRGRALIEAAASAASSPAVALNLGAALLPPAAAPPRLWSASCGWRARRGS
jgi:hypothetical protein